MKKEIRSYAKIQRRDLTDAEKAAGHIGAVVGIIPYNSDSGELRDRSLNNGRPFREQIAPDAFTRSVKEDGDIMGFIGHTDNPLASFARAGSNLTFTDSAEGMKWEALAPDTTACRDLMRLVDSGVIKGTSFEFAVRGSGEKWEKRDGADVRTITDARLYAVNPVAWPAYDDGALSVSMRSKARRDAYFGSSVAYDPTASADVVYAVEALGCEVCELCDALEYLRDNPAGAHVAYAQSEVADASVAVTALTAWLTANGATVPAELGDRAKAATTDAEKRAKESAPSPSTAADAEREMRFRVLSLSPANC
jgi:HK97 family phage prohead protease